MKKKTRPIKYPFVSSYLTQVYAIERFIKLIDKMAIKIRPFVKKHKIQAIAFTGTSGAAVAYPLSVKLKIPLICIRKDKSHYRDKYEGRTKVSSYIIVDDIIETGKTIEFIKKIVLKRSPKAKLEGIFLYECRCPFPLWKDTPVIGIR